MAQQIKNVQPKIPLYEYQKKYLENLPSKIIMAADTGTGKTFMALENYRRHAWGQPLLILAPASKVRTEDWERDITEYFGEGNEPEYEIYSYSKFARNPTMKQFKKGKRAVWKQFLPENTEREWAVIADECHKIKNSQSNRGDAVFKVTKDIRFFNGLSATPLPNGWIDVANYFKIFGKIKHITAFKNRYCQIVTYKGFPEIQSYFREDELTRKWRSISKRLTKAEANDLPDRTFIGVDFKRPTKYVETILERKDDDGEMLDTPGKLAHALRQTLTKPKMKYLSDLLEGTSENVVIFYNYISEREAILEMLDKKHKEKTVFRQDGEKHELPKKHEWAAIENSVTVAQYQSGSTGVEMTYATQVVYFSPTYSYSDYIQSIGRVYRNGQTNKTTFYNFRTPNSIEADIYDTLKSKSDFQVKQWVLKQEEKEKKYGSQKALSL